LTKSLETPQLQLLRISGFIQESSGILFVEMYAIYKGLLLAKYLKIEELVCHYLHCINHIKGLKAKYHIHIVIIQDIKEPLSQNNVYLCHKFREENQCVNFFLKHETSLNADLSIHASALKVIHDPLKSKTI
jgi:hypothetical protein